MIIRPPREEDIPALARVHVETWRTTYRGIIPDAYLDKLSYQDHEQRHRKWMTKPCTAYFVAEVEPDGIVGFIMGGTQRGQDVKYPGELYAINILEQHRRKGIGAALVQQWATSLRRAGLDSATVWVAAENEPAIAFYEKLGAKYLREKTIEIGGESLVESGYAWEDLSGLG